MRLVLIAFALLWVVACSPQETEADSASALTADAAQSQVSEAWPSNFQWLSGVNSGGRAFLYFGPDESDNIHMHFECAVGSGELTADAFDPRNEGAELVLISGDTRASFAAEPRRNEDIYGNGVKSEASVPVSAPVIAEFGRTGILSAGDPPTSFRPATPEELLRIGAFFAQCAHSS